MASTPGSQGRPPANRTPTVQVRTPSQRTLQTPLPRRDILTSGRRNASARRGQPRNNVGATPHATAARRALTQRRTAIFTPGKNRRRSLRDQRETPMGVLRNLGRILAPQSRRLSSSSSSAESPPSERRERTATMTPLREDDEEDEDTDELSIDRPRLSLPLDENDDSDEELRPPRLSTFDDNYTVQSVELPRREPVRDRLSRGSLGSVRVSDFFGNEGATETVNLGDRSDFFPGLLEDLQARRDERAAEGLQRVDEDTGRVTLGRESDFGLEMPEGLDDQTTFMFNELGPGPRSSSPLPEGSVTGAAADDAQADTGPAPDLELQPPSDSDPEPLPYNDGESPPAFNPFDDDDPPLEDLTREDFPMEDFTAQDPTRQTDFADVTRQTNPTQRSPTPTITSKLARSAALQALKRQKRISQHGIPYPALPTTFVKRVASKALQTSGLSNHKVSQDTLAALTQASEWFFEQLGDDLSAYANHAGRKTVEDADVATLMRRQRQVSTTATMFSLAQKHLPRELLQELRMPVPQISKKGRGKRRRDQVDDNE